MVVRVKAHTRRVSGKDVKVRSHKRAPRGHGNERGKTKRMKWGLFIVSKKPGVKINKFIGRAYYTKAEAEAVRQRYERDYRRQGIIGENEKLVVKPAEGVLVAPGPHK